MGMGEHDELRFAMERFGLQDFFDERHYAHMTLREVQVGDILSRQNFDLDSLYFLLEGDVRFFRFSGSGKMVVLGFGHGPSMIGEVELVLHKPTVAYTELMTDGTVVEIPMDYCRQAMSDDIDFANAIAFNLAQHLDAADINTTTNVALKLEEKSRATYYPLKKTDILSLICNCCRACSEPHTGTCYEASRRCVRQASSHRRTTDIPSLTEKLWHSMAATVTRSSLGPHTLARG